MWYILLAWLWFWVVVFLQNDYATVSVSISIKYVIRLNHAYNIYKNAQNQQPNPQILHHRTPQMVDDFIRVQI